MTLPELAVRRPVTTMVTLVCMLVIGWIALDRLPLAFMPEMQEKELHVIVDYPNSTPKVTEQMIVRPLEEALTSINGVKHTWARADTRQGRVNLNFEWGVDMDIVRVEVMERIERARDQLPDDVDLIRVSNSWDAGDSGETILEARLSSGRDLSKDYRLLERRIIKPLERIAGVSSVILDGVNPREIKINLNLNALKRHGLDARAVLDVLNKNNADQSLGIVRTDSFRTNLRAVGAFRTVEEIADLPITNTNLRVKDVAEVTYKEPPLDYGRHLHGQFAVGLSIAKESGANTVEVCDNVLTLVNQMSEDPELEGINFLVWENQGKEIKNTIADLKQTGLIGAFLAALVLFMFLRRTSTTLIAVSCIPFSLIVACGILWFQGRTLNTISLLGLIVGIGMLVDNAVVVMENIDRFQQRGFTNRVSALLGARQVSIAVTAATLTSVLAFAPLIFNKGSEMNVIFRELALTVCYTLLASLFVSQTLIPLATARFIKKGKAKPKGRIMAFLENNYEKTLDFTLKHRWLAPVVGLSVVASIYFPVSRMEFNFEPKNSEMYVEIAYKFSESLSLERKEDVITLVEQALEPHKEAFDVDAVYSWWSPNWSLTRLYMKDGFTHELHMNKVRKALPDLLPRIAGVDLEVRDNVPFWQRNRGKRLAFRLEGSDTDELERLAKEAAVYLENTPGLFDVYSSENSGNLELHTTLDRDRVWAYGLNPGYPGAAVELTFRGRRLPRFRGPDGEVEMRLTLDEKDVQSVENLRNLPLLREGKTPVPLDSFADFKVVKTPSMIVRNNKTTGIWIGAKYEDGKKSDYIDAIQPKLEAMDLPYGYSWVMNPGNREVEENQTELLISVILAVFLIFAVMAALFESIMQAFSIMVSLPFAIVGAAWCLFLFDIDVDQPAAIGVILLLGIVVNNGIVMIEHMNIYRRHGFERHQAMLRGGKERFRPILMTAVTTLMGLVPIAVQKPALAGVYYYSLAYVIIGGLVVSTVLTTLLLPATVTILEDFWAWILRLFGFKSRMKKPATGSEVLA